METLPLSPEDVSSLRRQYIPLVIFSFFVVGIFGAIFHFVLSNFEDFFPKVIFAAFGCIFAGFIVYTFWSYSQDIRGGVKHRIAGLITDKRLDVQTSSSTRGRNGSSKTTTTRHYYVYIDGKEYKLDYKYYRKAAVGNNVVMDRAPKSGYVFTFETTGVMPATEGAQRIDMNDAFLKTEIAEEPLTAEDIGAMNKQSGRILARKFMFLAPVLFIDIGLITSGLWGFVVFVFPLALIPIVQIVLMIITIVRHFRNKSHGYKTGLPAVVTDKTMLTGNRTKNKFAIGTDKRAFNVPESVYRNLNKGDKLILFKPKYGKLLLHVVTFEGEVHYI